MAEEPKDEAPSIVAYEIHSGAHELRPGTLERDWMSATNQRFAYRCLPLDVANQLGWDLLVQERFTARWNGGQAAQDVDVKTDSGDLPHGVSGFFGHGILTFTLSHLFRTPEEVDLLVTGPPNHPKDGLYALTGVVETDWSHATFTMNYLFTRPDHEITFEAGEPFCRILPIDRRLAESLEAVLRPIEDHPELAQAHHQWAQSRLAFNRDLKDPSSQARIKRWQKDYFRATQATEDERERHVVRPALKSFRRKGEE